MRKMTIAFVGMLMVTVVSVKGFSGVYDAFANLPESASNTIINNMEDGYDMRDYELFEVCATRALELELDGALQAFKTIFEGSDPAANAMGAVDAAELAPYFYVSILALGQLGDESEANQLFTALLRNDDNFIAFYIIKAYGYMTESETALGALNQACEWVDSVILARELINSLEEHKSLTSLNYLNNLYANSMFSSIRDEISEAITYISEVGVE